MSDDQYVSSVFDEGLKPYQRRRDMLPLWFKVFCWFFMIMGVFALISFLIALAGKPMGLEFYGFHSTSPLQPIGLLIVGLALFKGFSAFVLWTEKSFAIRLARWDAILGIILCIGMTILSLLGDRPILNFRIELILLTPYLIKLNRIREDWEDSPSLHL